MNGWQRVLRFHNFHRAVFYGRRPVDKVVQEKAGVAFADVLAPSCAQLKE